MKKRKCLGIIIAALILCLAAYTYWDNQRIIVRTQEIVIDQLPEAFEGYSILQISDLHGKYFGSGQKRLLETIATVPHDIILFTGDMNLGTESDTTSSQAILALLDGLQGERMLWVDGNCGPYTMENYIWPTGRLMEMGEVITSKGVEILTEPIKIEKEGSSIYFTGKLSWRNLKDSYECLDLSGIDADLRNAIEAYHARQVAWYQELNHEELTLIAVDHYPEQSYLSESTWSFAQHLPYDLMICGHTHGGQICLPLVGAVYIPVVSSSRGGYFPNQKDVRGLQYIQQIPQYTSAGLGASGNPVVRFRFFCPPEINRIVLKRK